MGAQSQWKWSSGFNKENKKKKRKKNEVESK
jgi:hypothetical protein